MKSAISFVLALAGGSSLATADYVPLILGRMSTTPADQLTIIEPGPDTFASLVGDGVGLTTNRKTTGTIENNTSIQQSFRITAAGIQLLNGLNQGASINKQSQALAMNDAGTAVGWSNIVSNGTSLPARAVRWEASSSVPTTLRGLSFDAAGVDDGSTAIGIGADGSAIGVANKYSASRVSLGSRAVVWFSEFSIPLELAPINTTPAGVGYEMPRAINRSATVVGYSEKYQPGTSTSLGGVAVRWTAGVPTELDSLGYDANGHFASQAYAINDAGTAVGVATDYRDHTNNHNGNRAVRWDANGTAVTVLGDLGRHATVGYTFCAATGINSAGTAIGSATKFSADGVNDLGSRAVRWNAGQTAALELGQISPGFSSYTAVYSINDAGLSVGWAYKFDPVSLTTLQHAVVWDNNGAATDLNALVDPSLGFTLVNAYSISNSNWVTGTGYYRDGIRGSSSFLIQVPEPGFIGVITSIGWILAARRRHTAVRTQSD